MFLATGDWSGGPVHTPKTILEIWPLDLGRAGVAVIFEEAVAG